MSKEVSLLYITLWYSTAVLATIFYLYGYFPVKPAGSNTLYDPPSIIEGIKVDAIKSYKPTIDRLVIFVIDAIRMDFVNERQMPYLMEELYKANGCVLKVHAEAPTVTMPRIKAMTTGSVPQYIDIALNLGARRLHEDSFLHRLKEMKKPIVFYGDNTWKFLFPNMFLRSEGVNSFYVTDYTEVDNNVTRNLPFELKQTDWKVLILHYLGLDHIGHVQGPFSHLTNKKLGEMDRIIQNITLSLNLNNTAVVITGDHGMRDAGSHGGTTPPEIEIPFAWIGKCPRKELSLIRSYEKQTDIAVTISALMGLSYPADSVGKLMPQLFDDKNIESLLYKYYYNAQMFVSKKKKLAKQFKKCFQLHEEFLNGLKIKNDTIECYEKNLKEVSDNLVREISTQVIPYLIISTLILFWSLLALALPQNNKLYVISILISIFVFFTETYLFGTKFSLIMSAILLSLCLVNGLEDFEKIIFSAFNANVVEQVFGIGSIIGTLCLVSSSFVEEEHQIWLFFLSTFIFYNVFRNSDDRKRINGKWIVTFIFLRFLRNLKSFGEFLKIEINLNYMKLFLIMSLLGTFLCILFHSKGTKKSSLVSLSIMILIYLYKIHLQNIYLVILFWTLTALNVIFERKNLKNTLPCIWMQIIALFMRPWNVILLPGFYISSQNILKYSPTLFIKIMSHIWLIRVFFNGQGNDNSIGSVDISPGYIGFSDFYPVLAGIQVLCNYYAFYILGYMLLLTYFKMKRENVQMFRICTIYKLFDMLYYCIVTIIHRNHLFIWSVFAPKLIIEAAHTGLLLFVMYSYFFIKNC